MTLSELDIGAVNDFVQGKPKRVEVNGRALVVVREQDEFYALHDTCPHQGASLSKGHVSGTTLYCKPGESIPYGSDGQILVCPWHGYEYNLRTGCSIFDPETIRVRSYLLHVEGDRVLINLNTGPR